MSKGDQAVLDVLREHDNNGAFPSAATIALQTGLTRRHVFRCLSRLVRFGAITKTGRKSRFGTYIYKIAEMSPASRQMSLAPAEMSPAAAEKMSPELSKDLPVVGLSVPRKLGTERPTPARPAKPRPRKRDPLWDTLEELLGRVETKSERGRRNRALAELREVGATSEQIRERAGIYRRRWPKVDLTATALTANWSLLGQNTGRVPGKASRTEFWARQKGGGLEADTA